MAKARIGALNAPGAAEATKIGAIALAPMSAPTTPMTIATASPRASLKPRYEWLIQPSTAPATIHTQEGFHGRDAPPSASALPCADELSGASVCQCTELSREPQHTRFPNREGKSQDRKSVV